MILDEDFKTLDPNVWSHEVQLGGFGTGAFDWTTTDASNSFVDGEGLHIVPTLTNQSTSITNVDIYNGYTLNLTADGSCTDKLPANCVAQSNRSLGYTIPPVRSARLTTKGKKFIKYGKIEVVAKLPAGDWLWPAIWSVKIQPSVFPALLTTLQDDARGVEIRRLAPERRDRYRRSSW